MAITKIWLSLLFTFVHAITIPQEVLTGNPHPICRESTSTFDAETTNDTIGIHAIGNPQRNGLNYDDRTNQWSGYIDLGPPGAQKHMFFWLLESKGNARTDPIILWLNGGPGCSSLYGLLTQWGTKILDVNGKLQNNKASLNDKATIIFLDQPGGQYNPPTITTTGFTYFDRGVPTTSTNAQAAQDVVDFITAFRQTTFVPGAAAPEYGTQDIHIAGESFAGHYIPAIGARTLTMIPPPAWKNSLKSVIIGNGWFDAAVQFPRNVDLVCSAAFFTPPDYRLSAAQCAQWTNQVGQCIAQTQACRTNALDTCLQAKTACNAVSGNKYWELQNRDQYDMSNPRPFNPNQDAPRNDQETQLFDYLNNDTTRPALNAMNRWKMIRWTITSDWNREWYLSSVPALDTILAQGNDVRVLLYAGDTDFACNWIGVKDVARAINWAGQPDFQREANARESEYRSLRDAKGEVYGSFISFSRLTYARIYGAGHMVNEKRPTESKDMFYSWIFKGGFWTFNDRSCEAKASDEL